MKRKKCFKCKKRKALNQFYKHPRMADGHLGKCKKCTKRDVSENYSDNREHYAEYERLRFKKPARRRYAVAQIRKYRKEHPERTKAHRDVAYALRTGKLTRQPCEKQPCDKKAQAHHEDYSKPLAVNWLCFKHHREHHGQTVTTER